MDNNNGDSSIINAIVALVAIVVIATFAYYTVEKLQNDQEDGKTIIDVQLPSGDEDKVN